MSFDVRRILKESVPILVLCTIGGVAAGIVLASMENELIEIPGLLILLPASLGMRGNISGALGSRLSSGLHMGFIEPKFTWNAPLKNNFWSAMILNIMMSFLLGLIAYMAYELSNVESHANILELTLISLLAGTFAGFILVALSIALALTTYSRGYDPDNILMPALSTVGDIITVFCLLVAVRVVGLIPYI